ncbi:uncharacterized protein [Panulirus ornatus]|uniref:uncharacterized protein n=1 Tax=Panulirus ornatus TaxID=150431 RepID=UPI003A89D9FA
MQPLADPLLVHQAADEARFFVYAYNATTLVTTAGLALGLFFIITAIALYYYYYSNTTNGRRSGREWEYTGNQSYNTLGLVEVLDLLEKAWAMYDVQEVECRRRLVCEAHLLPPDTVNKPMAGTLTHLLSQVTEDMLGQTSEDFADSVRQLQAAAQYGKEANSCQPYVQHCPHVGLSDLPHY